VTRPGLTDIDAVQFRTSGPPSAEFGSHEAYGFPQKHEFPNILMQDGKFHHFIIITIMVPFEHDYVIRRMNALGDPVLDDLRALVEFAWPGPIAGAADRLFQTPSAITRQVQSWRLHWVPSCSTAR